MKQIRVEIDPRRSGKARVFVHGQEVKRVSRVRVVNQAGDDEVATATVEIDLAVDMVEVTDMVQGESDATGRLES